MSIWSTFGDIFEYLDFFQVQGSLQTQHFQILVRHVGTFYVTTLESTLDPLLSYFLQVPVALADC